MMRLGILRGRGDVFWDGVHQGAVDYEITAWQRQDGGKQADGAISADAQLLVKLAMIGRQLTLKLAAGGTAQISLVRTTGTRAAIRISGPLPGF